LCRWQVVPVGTTGTVLYCLHKEVGTFLGHSVTQRRMLLTAANDGTSQGGYKPIEFIIESLYIVWCLMLYKNWGCPADLLANQTVLDPKVHCHTSRAQQVGIKPTSPPTKVVALPTEPQIPIYVVYVVYVFNVNCHGVCNLRLHAICM
jgi:hypothetical protein